MSDAVHSALLFEKYCGLEREIDGHSYRIATKRVVVDIGVADQAAAVLEGLLPRDGTCLVVADSNTWTVAGERVAQSLVEAGWKADSLRVLERGAHAVCDDESIEHIRAALSDGGYTSAIAVGAGTINDIVKMASFQADIPYAAVGTAPSMNGYTSAIAAILSNGVKTTQPCHMPVAVLADLDVMAEAPYRMIASGLGDLLSKPVSNADWRLGARLADAFYTSFPLEMIDAAGRALDGVPGKLPSRDRDAVRGLCDSIMLSGMAMAAVGTSSPASGGEHLVSHYLDMVAIAQGEEHDFHGCQVGVGTLTTAAIYEKLCALDPLEIDVEGLVRRHVPWSVYKRTIVSRFGPFGLTEAVLPHAEANYPSRQVLRVRLAALVESWQDVMEDVSRTLEPAAAIRQKLVDAEAPHTYAQIGVGAEAARRTVLHCKDIRSRYTVLDLASELGRLEPWVDELLAPGSWLLG